MGDLSKKDEHYTLRDILHEGVPQNAKYYMIYGKRSNGKTYACKSLGLNGFKDKEIDIKGYIQDGSQFAYIRRWDEDFKRKRGATLFDDLVKQGKIKEWTNGEWTDVIYYSDRWYLARYDEKIDKMVHDIEPFAYAFSLSQMEHDKSSSYPKINKIIFDEFLTRGIYLPDEFVVFMNVLSTIIRDRDDVTIFMLGNTVNQYCPYFSEMGINPKKIKQGTISLFKYGKEKELKVVVEYCPDIKAINKKGSDLYFAFENAKLNMITGGAWEMEIYPHIPVKYLPKDVKYTFFISFGGEMLHCDIVKFDKYNFIYIHKKTTPLKNEDKDLIYSSDFIPKKNWRRKITKPFFPIEKLIYQYFMLEQVYYQDNEVGEMVRNYLLWCESSTI